MSRLNVLLQNGRIRQTVFGLSRSHLNSVKIFSIDKSFSIRQDSISMVYEAAISYYNAGFAKETGIIHQPNDIIEGYLNLIARIYSEAFDHKKSVIFLSDTYKEDSLLDYSLFCLYILLINDKRMFERAVEKFQIDGVEIISLCQIIYDTSKEELHRFDRIQSQLPIDKWTIVAKVIISKFKQPRSI